MNATKIYDKAYREGWSQELEDAIIDAGNSELITDFAAFIDGANISRLEDAVIEIGKPEWIVNFARDVGKEMGADIDKLAEAVVDTGDIENIMEFMYVKGANRDYIKNKSIKGIVDSGDPMYALFFAEKLSKTKLPTEEDMDRLLKVVLDFGDPDIIMAYATRVKGANLKLIKKEFGQFTDKSYYKDLINKFPKIGNTKNYGTATAEELEKIFKYFHLSSARLDLKKNNFTFTPRIPKNPLEAEDNFTPRISLGKTIDLCIEALGTFETYHVYAVDVRKDPTDDVSLYSTKRRLPKCPSSKGNEYGIGFSLDKYVRSKYKDVMKKFGFSPLNSTDIHHFLRFAQENNIFKTGTMIPKEFKGCVPDAENTDEMWSTKNITMYYVGRLISASEIDLSRTGRMLMNNYGKKKLKKEIRRIIGGTINGKTKIHFN